MIPARGRLFLVTRLVADRRRSSHIGVATASAGCEGRVRLSARWYDAPDSHPTVASRRLAVINLRNLHEGQYRATVPIDPNEIEVRSVNGEGGSAVLESNL